MPTQRKTSSTLKFYGRIGRKGWRTTRYYTFTSAYPMLREWLVARISRNRKMVLSIGCGTGELERDLGARRHRVIAVDMSHEMLQSAARRGAKRLVQANAQMLPFKDGAFDLVMFPESIGCLRLNKVFPQALRVMKKRGELLLTTYPAHAGSNPHYKSFGRKEVVRQLTRAGFQVKEIKFLKIQRKAVTEVEDEEKSSLVFMVAKRASRQ